VKRTVVITGGTKGLGRELALAFSQAGYFIYAFYSSDEKAAEDLRLLLAAAEAGSCVLRYDVTTENESIWKRPEISEAESLILIHNACAPFSPTPLHQLRWQDFGAGFDVAVKGGWLCSQALIRPMLKAKRRAIVNVLTSAIESAPPKGFAAYVTAKQALRGLTLALAAEYGPMGVRVFTASPGYMDTPLTERWDDRFREAIRAASRVTDPVFAARRLVELVESDTVQGRGEDYPV
jgi:3-oxoacyl-[acyl-carrier protein] reductase